MINDVKQELKPTKTFKQKAAETVGDLLLGSANGSKNVCGAILIAEPKYPIDLLKKDLED